MFGSSAPFGSSSGGFGQNTTPAFGSPAPAQFGGGGFGAPAPAPAPFGSPAPAPGGFGGFGAPAPTPGFGGATAFGTPAPAPSAFGSTGGFGSSINTSSPFGAPAPAPAGGLFGAAPAPSPGLFGSAPAPAPGGFGSNNTGFGGFGSAPTPAPAFGGGSTFGAPAPAPAAGLFGAPAAAPGGFGSSGFGSTTSTFGSPAPAPAGGMFGAPAPAPAPGGMFGAPAAPGGGGTKMTPFAVTTRQDGSASINLQCISAMSQYETKSCEELRFEDYSQGNRGTGSATGAPGGFGGFGSPAPAPSGGLFGAPAPAPGGFGAPAPAPGGFGGFGSPAPAPGGFGGSFGAPAPAAFGAPAPAAFGAPAPAPGGFGFGAPAPAPSGGLFGAPAPAPPGGLFGAAPAAAPGGLFGSTPAPAFGSPAPAPGGLFGAPAPAPPGGLFGGPAPAPAFGAPAPAQFGAPAPGGFGTFGSPAPAPGGLFGAPAPAPGGFGAPAPAGGLFAPAAAPPGGLFGAPAPTPTYGAPAGGLFGAPAPAPGGYYGVPPPAAQTIPAAPAIGSVMPPATNEILTAQLTALENKRKEIEKSDNFRGKKTESSSINGMSMSEKEGLSSLTPVRASYKSYRPSPRSNTKIRPRGFASPEKTTIPSLSRLGSGGKPMAAPDSMAASSVTRLVINPSPKPKMKLMLNSSAPVEEPQLMLAGQPAASPREKISFTRAPPDQTSATPEAVRTPVNIDRNSEGNNGDPSLDYYKQVLGSPDEAAGVASPAKKGAAPVLTKAGYSCTPSVEKLQSMPPEDLAAVPNFSVERPGVGRIEWEGAVDVRGANLDTVVVIEEKPHSASVYTKEEGEGTKPPVGTKLNRPAIITLENIFPPKGVSSEKFARKVEKSTKRNHAELIEYDASSGKWKFRVLHFSRYALTDDDSESETENEQHFESGEREGRSRVTKGILKERKDTPFKLQTKFGSSGEDSDKGDDVDMKIESQIFTEAENAFESMQMQLKASLHGGSLKKKEVGNFPEERNARRENCMRSRVIPSEDDHRAASTRRGVCSRIAREAGVKSSNIDLGLRMGRSFRVGWAPDGSFFSLKKGGVLVRSKPVFSNETKDQEKLLGNLRKNSCNVATAGDGCPQISLPSSETDKGKLQEALKAYSDNDATVVDESTGSIAQQAFSLLSCLLDSKDNSQNDQLVPTSREPRPDSGVLEARRLNAITLWLVNSCSLEVDGEIQSCKSRNDKFAAILAAVSGGDIEKACKVAEHFGCLNLASLIACAPEARSDVLNQVLQWTDSGPASRIPPELTRAYFLIGGSSKMEEDVYRKKYSSFDWRRRLAMRLVYESSLTGSNLESLIQEYEAKLKRGVVPFPQPQHLGSSSRESIQCVLYRILRFGINGLEISLREIIAPVGHTKSAHDFSLAFHLAAAISALGCSCPLTGVEEQHLIDGYAAQLISQGSWEWAVYISLFVFEGKKKSYSGKSKKAKDLVIQNFSQGSPGAQECRQFLEDAGVPSAWFEEALAVRNAANGDSYGYLNHMVNVSTDEMCTTLEQILIPNMLFMNKERLDESLRLIEVFAVDENSLANAVYNFFQLYQSILSLEGACASEIEAAMPALVETCESVEQVFLTYKSEEERQQGPSTRFVPTVVPLSSFLAEGLSQLSLFRLQMKALEDGISIASTASQILNLSRQAPREFKGSGMSAREDICRWLM